MSFTAADPTSLVLFLGIVAAVIGMQVGGVFAASKRLGGPAGKRAGLVAGVLLAWLLIVAAVVESGVLAASPLPYLVLFFGLSQVLAVVWALSPVGRWLAAGLPIAELVAFQGFRLPLELVLHNWVASGTIPATMTWTGANFGIISGVVALVAAPWAATSRRVAWTANLIGIVLLLNVMRVAIMSSPLPFAWNVTPPLQLAFHLPYALIVPFCVAGALAGHIVLTRALLRSPT